MCIYHPKMVSIRLFLANIFHWVLFDFTWCFLKSSLNFSMLAQSWGESYTDPGLDGSQESLDTVITVMSGNFRPPQDVDYTGVAAEFRGIRDSTLFPIYTDDSTAGAADLAAGGIAAVTGAEYFEAVIPSTYTTNFLTTLTMRLLGFWNRAYLVTPSPTPSPTTSPTPTPYAE